MKLTEFSWKEEGGKHVLDCQITIEEDGSFSVIGRQNPNTEKAAFTSADDLGQAMARALHERHAATA